MISETHLDQCQVFQIEPEEVISVKPKDGSEQKGKTSWGRHFLNRLLSLCFLQLDHLKHGLGKTDVDKGLLLPKCS